MKHIRTLAQCLSLLTAITLTCPQRALANWEIGDPVVTMWGLGLPALNDELAEYAAEGGFNLVSVSRPSELTIAERHGLRAMYWSGSLLTPAAVGDPVLQPQLDTLISRVRNHPAMYAYMLGDEPHASEFSGLSQLVEHVRERDPDNLGYINLFPTYATPSQLGASNYNEYINEFIDTVQPSLLSSDYYQFTTSGDSPEYFENLAVLSKKAREAERPFLNIVQGSAHDVGYREPNEHELRFLNYTNLAYGAQGIMYWTGVNESNNGPVEMPASVYNALKPLNAEFVAVAKELQSATSIGAYHLGDRPPGTVRLPSHSPFYLAPSIPNSVYQTSAPVKGALVGLFGTDTTLGSASHALVVNLDYQNARTLTVVGPEDLAIFDASTGEWSSAGGHQVTLNLLPGGGILVGFASIHLASLPGDYNDDGVVDAADFTKWRDSLGIQSDLANDPIGGIVGTAQYELWRDNFGSAAAGNGAGANFGPQSASVPEPTYLSLLVILVLSILACRHH